MATFLRRFRPAALVLLAACSSSTGLPDPTLSNTIENLTLGALIGTPIAAASAFNISSGAVRTDQTAEFEFAFNIVVTGADSQRVLLPRAALGLPAATAADPGLQQRTESFDDVVLAQSDGYVTDRPVPIGIGEVFVVRSRVVCTALGVPLYAKLEVLSFDGAFVTLKILTNENCGSKNLAPGIPPS
jgi:hypothetical protein